MTQRDVLKIAKSNLLQDISLWEIFLESTSKINIEGITEENKKGIFQLLVEKSTNKWFETKKTGQTFRDALKGYTKSKINAKYK